ncbi:hypothetical protein NQ318_004630 [Aromia moschata]|uniref:Uncharacterized protein n=1 Tax=Aromia moschata TaxID=1265417 RepID=A0AAV8Y627_9CUCU|nr:hypothetical protein NQ318_004630 [Aromia moschata]
MCPKRNKLFCVICLVMGGNQSTWTQEGRGAAAAVTFVLRRLSWRFKVRSCNYICGAELSKTESKQAGERGWEGGARERKCKVGWWTWVQRGCPEIAIVMAVKLPQRRTRALPRGTLFYGCEEIARHEFWRRIKTACYAGFWANAKAYDKLKEILTSAYTLSAGQTARKF